MRRLAELRWGRNNPIHQFRTKEELDYDYKKIGELMEIIKQGRPQEAVQFVKMHDSFMLRRKRVRKQTVFRRFLSLFMSLCCRNGVTRRKLRRRRSSRQRSQGL